MSYFDITHALRTLRPTSHWAISGKQEYSNLEWYSDDAKPTEEELNTELTRIENEEKMTRLREERDKRLTASDWVITMHKELGTNIPAAWKNYRQALRDLPSSATPILCHHAENEIGIKGVTWPTKPT